MAGLCCVTPHMGLILSVPLLMPMVGGSDSHRGRPPCAGRSAGKRRRDLRNNNDISVLGLHDTDGAHTLGIRGPSWFSPRSTPSPCPSTFQRPCSAPRMSRTLAAGQGCILGTASNHRRRGADRQLDTTGPCVHDSCYKVTCKIHKLHAGCRDMEYAILK